METVLYSLTIPFCVGGSVVEALYRGYSSSIKSSVRSKSKCSLLDIVGSRVRYAVLLVLAKAYKLGIPVTIRSIIRVFGLNIPETYRFVNKLLEEGLVVKNKSGYILSEKGAKLVDFVYTTVPRLGDEFDYFRKYIPDTMYYIVVPRFQSWFGVYKPLVIVDKKLKNMVKTPSNATIVYCVMRGRDYRYDWDNYVSQSSSIEQAYADLISYDKEWISYTPDILLNLDQIDIDLLLEKASPEGRKRIATAVAYYTTVTGLRYRVPPRVFRLLDESLVDEIASFVTPLVFDSRVIEARNL